MTAFGRGKPIVSPVHPSVREVAVLQQATQMVLSSVDSDTLVHHMLLVVRNYFGASQSAVYLADAATRELHCRAQNGYEPDEAKIPLSIGKESIAGWAAFTRAPLYIPDLKQEERHQLRDGRIASVLALPLLVRERALGVLEIRSEETNAFDSDAIGLLSVFASQAAIALENARLYSADLRRMRQIEIINLIARTAAAAKDTQQFYDMLVELISDTFEEPKSRLCSRLRTASYRSRRLLAFPKFFRTEYQHRVSAAYWRQVLLSAPSHSSTISPRVLTGLRSFRV
jgi:transcriptional regulator with GAF, ATPase, and Fis domain